MAAIIMESYPHAKKFFVFIGKGNNGGDGLVVARVLAAAGKTVQVVLTSRGDQLGELAGSRLKLLREAVTPVEIVPWQSEFVFPGSDAVVIDALLGIQGKGPLRGVLAEVVSKMNEARATNFFRTVALDFPSGLARAGGQVRMENRDDAVVADMTIAVGFAKEALGREIHAAWVGRLEVAPWSQVPAASDLHQILVPSELARLLPRRSAFSHKGDYGRLAIIAGSPGFAGAATLCALAAQAMGMGLLSVVTRPEALAQVAAQAPHEAMISAWADLENIPDVIENATAIVIGPGLGTDAVAEKMLRAVLTRKCPVLIDADGLNILGQHLAWLREAKGPLLLTPHPGEMGRLIGRKFAPEEREGIARDFPDWHKLTLVLKGTRTLVTTSGQPLYTNTTGNPGLSTGGSGDTLSGMIGALLAQGLAPLDAARLGVWLHGHAADLVLAERGCEEGMTPTMLSANLGRALVSLRRHAAPRPGLIERARELV